MTPIARGVIERRRRRTAAEWAVVPHISPDVPPCFIGKVILRQSTVVSQPTKVDREHLPDVHPESNPVSQIHNEGAVEVRYEKSHAYCR